MAEIMLVFLVDEVFMIFAIKRSRIDTLRKCCEDLMSVVYYEKWFFCINHMYMGIRILHCCIIWVIIHTVEGCQ